jgi:NADH-quinone oxidoreductase subunit E
MSVRRLADESIQPAAFAFSSENQTWAEKKIREYPVGRQQSAVIPLLMRAQEQDGWITRAAIESVAKMLDMAYIRVLEVATFYTQFQLKPVGTRAHVQVCGTTPCMLRGAAALIDVCRDKIHPEQHHVSSDGTLSWEEVECLGACVNAPMVMIFKDTFEDLTPERLAEIVDQFAAGHGGSVPVGPQNGRIVSTPLGGLTTLTSESAVLKTTREEEAREAARQADAALPPLAPEAVARPAAADTAEPQPAVVPPSRAGRPRTYAAETNGSLKTPSASKASAAGEKAVSAPATPYDPLAANRTARAVESESRQRKPARGRPEEVKELKSPELLRGEPIGAYRKKPEAVARPPLDHPNRPAKIDRPANPDDLKLISGIGPKIEGVLHSLGIFTFAQVASWTGGERDWVDSYLNFRGRIERDQWARQAEALAKGGVAEYARVFGRVPR